MSYTAPSIGPAGLTIPQYSDILGLYVTSAQNTYGQTTYLDPDAADYQMLAIEALIASDCMQALQLIYNSRSPVTAIGSALDPLGKICGGIARIGATFSTCTVTLTGTANTVINNGVVQDVYGNLWNLPNPVTITGGSVNVTATAQVAGPINVTTGQINIMAQGLTAGWTAVTNPSASVPGVNQESDSQYRARMAISTSLPSSTRFAATVAAIAATPGVTRSFGIENPTGSVDSFGNPAHSITMVIENGADAEIAEAIFNNKTPGCATNGTTSYTYTSPNTGDTLVIDYYRPTYVPIYVTLGVHAINGYTTATTTAIQNAVVAYLNQLALGTLLVIASGIEAAAMAVQPNIANPMFSIRSLTLGTSASPTGTSDIALLFYQAAQGLSANIVINLV